jgi:dTDP-L-rhamnose 4-epimerase
MENDDANNQVFNVGTGTGTSVLEFARLLRDAYGVEVEPIKPGEFRPMDFRHLMADNRRITALGWKPTVPVKEGVRRYASWIQSKNRPREYFSQAEETLKQMRIVRKAR